MSLMFVPWQKLSMKGYEDSGVFWFGKRWARVLGAEGDRGGGRRFFRVFIGRCEAATMQEFSPVTRGLKGGIWGFEEAFLWVRVSRRMRVNRSVGGWGFMGYESPRWIFW